MIFQALRPSIGAETGPATACDPFLFEDSRLSPPALAPTTNTLLSKCLLPQVPVYKMPMLIFHQRWITQAVN